MRVLIDASTLSVGGAIQVGLGILASAARTQGHEWHLVLSNKMAAEFRTAPEAPITSVHCLRRSFKPYSQVREWMFSLPRLERAIAPEVVFTIFGPNGWRARAPHLEGFAYVTLLYPDSPHLARLPWHQRQKARCQDWWAAVRIRKHKRWVAETETTRQRMERILGIPAERVSVVRNSYSPVFAAYFGERGRTAPEPGPRQILVPAAYYPHKNLDIVPAVAALLKKQVAEPFRFVFTVPSESFGWKMLQEQAAKHGVSELITTNGPVPHHDFPRLYERAHAVFLPTLLECSTAAYPEAFLAERPLVTSDRDFARELCGEGALYVDPMSPADAAQALARVITDADVRARLLDGARVALRENYPTPEQKWRGYLDCLQNVAGMASRGC
jgi:glycosyltransferase involved in cell wall biosynthesis